MTADDAQRSAKEALSKIAEEVQSRRIELAHRLGLDAAAAPGALAAASVGGAAAATGPDAKANVETLIQAAVEALGPRYETASRAANAAKLAEAPAVAASEAASPEAGAERVEAERAPSQAEPPWFAPKPPVKETAKLATEAAVSAPMPAAESTVRAGDGPATPAPQPPSAAPADATVNAAEPAEPASAPSAGAAPPTSQEAAAPPSFSFASPTESARSETGASLIPQPAPASLRARMTRAAARTFDNARVGSVATTYFLMIVAVLALAAAVYQAYVFHAGLDAVRRAVARSDYARACRDLVDSYYTVKQKVGVLMPAADRSNVAGASRVTEYNRLEAQAAVARFGALGTYLAAVQDPGTRARYTELMRTLAGAVETARTTQLTDIDKLFEPADKLFGVMNDDCTRLSQPSRL